MASCILYPNKGTDTFKKLSNSLGREQAIEVFERITSTQFKQMFGDQVFYDKDGIPTYESIMKLPIVQEYVGESKVLTHLNSQQEIMEDTLSNVQVLINRAALFNKKNKDKIAIVDYTKDNKITIKIEKRTEDNKSIAENQLKIQRLNEAIAKLLNPLGLNIGMLSSAEVAIGRVGVTEFNRAKDKAEGFSVLINVANNLEGYGAISEEFAHFVLGLFHDKPLVQRSISALKNQELAREILGEQFDKVYEYYNGDMSLVAEEAAGHIFKELLLDKINHKESQKPSIFKRMTNFVVGLFKDVNPYVYRQTIEAVYNNLEVLAKDVLEGRERLTKEQLMKNYRKVSFNALSERVNVQIKSLKTIVKRLEKMAALQEEITDKDSNIKIKRDTYSYLGDVTTKVKRFIKEGHTINAIVAFIDNTNDHLQGMYDKLLEIEALSQKDRFILLRDIQNIIEAFQETINDLRIITAGEFLEDNDIQSQMIIDDSTNSLKEYEVTEQIEPSEDVINMSNSEKAQRIQEDTQNIQLVDNNHYEDANGQKSIRVTKVIEATRDGKEFDPNSPWVAPSTNIGTGIDEMTRDFMAGIITKVNDVWGVTVGDRHIPVHEIYPNIDEVSGQIFATHLQKFAWAHRHITFMPRDVTINGTIETVDDTGKIHKVSAAGTLDLLGYDSNGTWYIFDMKTHRADLENDSNSLNSHKIKWTKQLSLYKKFLSEKYDIPLEKIKTSIIPIKVNYPAPLGGTSQATAVYTVSPNKHNSYHGKESNQLLLDGQEFKGAQPKLWTKQGQPVKTIPIGSKTVEVDYKKLYNDPTGGISQTGTTLKNTLDGISGMLDKIKAAYKRTLKPQFINFIRPITGDTVLIPDPYHKGQMKSVSVEEAFERGIDPGSIVTWVNSMADSPDIVLQILDKVYKNAVDNNRQRLIDTIQQIKVMAIKYEQLGITNYNFMYEEDKANYVNKKYNLSAFNKARQKFEDYLDRKYGATPEIGSTEFNKKSDERVKWFKENTVLDKDTYQKIPDPAKYPSRFESFSTNQKNFYEEYMQFKGNLDILLGEGKTTLHNSIKIRKRGIERVRESLKGNIIQETIESLKETFKKSFDDDIQYKNASAVTNLRGEERMTVPIFYTSKIASDDISTDAIASLIVYADMCLNYEAMSDIATPLEVGKDLLIERKLQKTKGGKLVQDAHSGEQIYDNTETSNYWKMINDFMTSKVYGRYMHDSGEVAGVDVNKASSLILKLASYAQLGLNSIAHLASAMTGNFMVSYEAIAGEYFNLKDLATADKIFMSEMGEYAGDIGQRVTKSKLALTSELLDVRQNLRGMVNRTSWSNKNLLTRLFGPHLAFFGQTAGDFWLYNRVAIAMLRNIKVTQNGKSTNLWDCLKAVPIDPKVPEAGNKLIIEGDVKDEDGNSITKQKLSEISGQIRDVNQHLFGIYNQEDAVMARRTILGRMAMQYKDFLPSQYRYRFGKMTTNFEKGQNAVREGYYRTIARLAGDLVKGKAKWSTCYKNLSKHEQSNVRRAVAEVVTFTIMSLLAWILVGSKKKDDPWFKKMARLLALRMRTELGAMAPNPQMLQELLTIMKSPIACTDIIQDTVNMTKLMLPWNYFDEIDTGKYRGHSTAYKAFFESPFMGIKRNVERVATPEDIERYYKQNL